MKIELNEMCLSDNRLQQLAENMLLPDEVAAIESHVGTCQRCRDLLESRSIDSHWNSDILPALRASREDLRELSHDEESIDSLLSLLGPTDDPEMLGRIADYEVVGVIGRGGMGVVFKAFDRSLNRFVAIKMLLPHLATTGAARKRFEREGQAAAAVIDDHVLPIYAVSQWQGVPYLVTQYLRGNTLQKMIHDTGPLELRDILRIGMQTALGLAAAHAQGLVHRDVKPSNILLDGAVSRAMLTDFGLARAADDASITRTGMIAGTPQYMSPEQARGGSVDARSDLFGLGCVLYAMCTGRPPFRADSSYAILRMITDDEPRSIREINPDIPEWLCKIVRKLMAKEAADRFESADVVAKLLEECLAHVHAPTCNALPRVKFRSTILKRFSSIMSDKRLLSLLSLSLFVAAALFPWPIASIGHPEPAIIFAGVALLLAFFFAVLSRSEYFSRVVLWTVGGVLGLMLIGMMLSVPLYFLNRQAAIQRDVAKAKLAEARESAVRLQSESAPLEGSPGPESAPLEGSLVSNSHRPVPLLPSSRRPLFRKSEMPPASTSLSISLCLCLFSKIVTQLSPTQM